MLPCGLFLLVCLWLSPSLKESCLEFRILSLFHSFSHFLLKLLLVLTSIPIHLGREFLPCETRYPAWLGRGGGGRRGSGYDKRKHFNTQQGCLGKEWGVTSALLQLLLAIYFLTSLISEMLALRAPPPDIGLIRFEVKGLACSRRCLKGERLKW